MGTSFVDPHDNKKYSYGLGSIGAWRKATEEGKYSGSFKQYTRERKAEYDKAYNELKGLGYAYVKPKKNTFGPGSWKLDMSKATGAEVLPGTNIPQYKPNEGTADKDLVRNPVANKGSTVGNMDQTTYEDVGNSPRDKRKRAFRGNSSVTL